uniref:Uncharacterized protein n=1 Tax=Eutreptiella gymnastica TaxID=73025 RepID=A0A7S1J268_9EUGL
MPERCSGCPPHSASLPHTKYTHGQPTTHCAKGVGTAGGPVCPGLVWFYLGQDPSPIPLNGGWRVLPSAFQSVGDAGAERVRQGRRGGHSLGAGMRKGGVEGDAGVGVDPGPSMGVEGIWNHVWQRRGGADG